MTHPVPIDQVAFAIDPKTTYDEVYRCFQDPSNNGLLFRLVEKSERKDGDDEATIIQKWSFHNDTTDTVMKVRAFFQPTGKLTPDRRCAISTAAGKDRDGNDVELTVVDAVVSPGDTHPFIVGVVNGFELEFQADAAPEPRGSVEFVHRAPRTRYDDIYKCFKNQGNGLLFRLVEKRTGTWYFFNDTDEYNMTATVEFSDRKDVAPEGNTVEVGVPEEYPEGVILSVTVAPNTVEAFIVGNPINYRMSYAADPINNDKPEDPSTIQFVHPNGPNRAVINHDDADIFRCFKKNGNGLLFRIVDGRQWAYYNDTEDYVMTAIVRIANSEHFIPSQHARAEEDPEDPNMTVVTMEIPPGETLKFIDGAPKNYETRYSAEGRNQPKPEEAPTYRFDGPAPGVMKYSVVTKVVKGNNSDETILFRLFDPEIKQWGFYNDSDDVTITCRITFDDDAVIESLGNTTRDAQNPNLLTIAVEPHATVPFARGSYTSFKSEFTGTRKVASPDASATS